MHMNNFRYYHNFSNWFENLNSEILERLTVMGNSIFLVDDINKKI